METVRLIPNRIAIGKYLLGKKKKKNIYVIEKD